MEREEKNLAGTAAGRKGSPEEKFSTNPVLGHCKFRLARLAGNAANAYATG
jgi:hypothetical protein